MVIWWKKIHLISSTYPHLYHVSKTRFKHVMEIMSYTHCNMVKENSFSLPQVYLIYMYVISFHMLTMWSKPHDLHVILFLPHYYTSYTHVLTRLYHMSNTTFFARGILVDHMGPSLDSSRSPPVNPMVSTYCPPWEIDRYILLTID